MTGRRATFRAVLLAMLMALSLVAMSATFVGTTAAQPDMTVTVDAELSDAPGEETEVTFLLVRQGDGEQFDEVTATIGPDETTTGEVTLTGAFDGELEEGDDLAVNPLLDADIGYDANVSSVFIGDVQPGEEYDLTGLITYDAEPVSVTVDATLETAPTEETTVSFDLIEGSSGMGVDSAIATVPAGETGTGDVTMEADFTHPMLESGDELEVVASAENYSDATASATDELRPGDDITVTGELVLESELDTNPSVEMYANEDGFVEISGVREAIGDWRVGDIDVGLVMEVIDTWRTGAQVDA